MVSSDPSPTIRIQNVSRRFGAQEVLRDITMDVHPGSIVGLLGPSGSGKTTLIKMIAGSDAPTGGTVHVHGQLMPTLTVLPQIGYMAQSDALYMELSARENMEFFGALYDLSGRKLRDRIEQLAALVNLGGDLDRPIGLFSGGMKRRLSLAIALLHEPTILILDEPTVGIDPVLRKSVWAELRGYADAGTSILVTTHVMDEADKCDTVAMIRDGRVIASDTPEKLKAGISVSTIEEVFLHYSSVREPPPPAPGVVS